MADEHFAQSPQCPLAYILCPRLTVHNRQLATGNPQDPVDWYQATYLNLVLVLYNKNSQTKNIARLFYYK